MTRRNQALNESLARSSRPLPDFGGMSLDQYYLALGKASKADYEAGRITQGMFLARVKALRQEYDSLKQKGL